MSTKPLDAVVIGAGPAGCAAALTLAQRGRRVVVAERQVFPRFHIGESLLPASNSLITELGLQDRLRGAGFVEKRGASFCSEDGEITGHVDFALAHGVPDPTTFHVSRDRFDDLLLDAVRDNGIEVQQPCRAADIELGHDGVAAVLEDEGGHRRRVEAEFLVDASGQSGLLAHRLDLRRRDRELSNVAIHARFTGIDRPAPPRDGDIRIVSLGRLGWVWLIPLEDDVTSVGVVLPHELDREIGISRSPERLVEYLDGIPALEGVVADARLEGAVRRDADFSYSTRRYAGDRWLLVGDAASFIDPIFSTGVLIALESGHEAGVAIDRALNGGPAPGSLAAFERRQHRRQRFYHRFARAFYDPAFRDLFLQPSDRFGLRSGVTTALAGVWDLGLSDRLRLLLFFGLVALQRRVAIVPRAHLPVRRGVRPGDAGR